MFKFYTGLPTTYTIFGREFKVDLSLGTVINMLRMIHDDKLSVQGRIDYALVFLFGKEKSTREFFKGLDYDTKFAIYKDIYEQGISLPEAVGSEPDTDLLGNPLNGNSQGATYSLEYDSSAIYASFMQTYGIDLERSRKTLNWQKFNALLSGLPENTKFAEVMKYRNMDTSKIKDPEQKAYYERMKVLYALPEQFRDGL